MSIGRRKASFHVCLGSCTNENIELLTDESNRKKASISRKN